VRSGFNSFSTAAAAAAAAARAETACWRRQTTNNNMCYKGMGRFLCTLYTYLYTAVRNKNNSFSLRLLRIKLWVCVPIDVLATSRITWKISLPTFTWKHDRDIIMYYYYYIPSHVQHIPIPTRIPYIHT